MAGVKALPAPMPDDKHLYAWRGGHAPRYFIRSFRRYLRSWFWWSGGYYQRQVCVFRTEAYRVKNGTVGAPLRGDIDRGWHTAFKVLWARHGVTLVWQLRQSRSVGSSGGWAANRYDRGLTVGGSAVMAHNDTGFTLVNLFCRKHDSVSDGVVMADEIFSSSHPLLHHHGR